MRSEYKLHDRLNFGSYARMPKYLFDEPYKRLSSEAKILYVLMLDKLSLSLENWWTDSDDHVYITYSRDHMMKDLNVGSKSTITKIIKELTDAGLIREQSFAIGYPNRIFIAKV